MDLENIEEKELYFGSPDKKVKLNYINSKVWKFNESELQTNPDNLGKIHTLSKLGPLDFCGKDYRNVYLPCVPSLELFYKDVNASLKEPEKDDCFINNPIIKTDSEKPDVIGFQSGKRSCIVKSKDKFMRLKGCGNLNVGFPLEKLTSNKAEALDIRGCAFYHTSLREQYMTDKINKVLGKHGLFSANKSTGVWRYNNTKDFERLKLENSCPLVDKYCGVFETLGERRLASHLLQGVEVFLHYLIDNHLNSKVDVNYLINLFPSDRQQPDDPKNPIVPLEWLGPYLDIPQDKTLKEWTVNKIYPEESIAQVLDLASKASTIQTEIGKFFEISNVNDLIKGFMETYEIKENYKKLVASYIEALSKVNILELAAFLYKRVGYECGVVEKILEDADISWGYFADHHALLYHCNAHPNNFVVLPQENNRFLLAPLDFDLSFTRENFVNIDSRQGVFGENDQRLFDIFKNCERFELEHALSGEENMGNFNYSGMELKAKQDTTTKIYPILKKALRDTCVYHYRKAYDRYEDKEMDGYQASKDGSIYNLIKLSLIITRDVIA